MPEGSGSTWRAWPAYADSLTLGWHHQGLPCVLFFSKSFNVQFSGFQNIHKVVSLSPCSNLEYFYQPAKKPVPISSHLPVLPSTSPVSH